MLEGMKMSRKGQNCCWRALALIHRARQPDEDVNPLGSPRSEQQAIAVLYNQASYSGMEAPSISIRRFGQLDD